MIVGVPREIASGECRVALVPDAVKSLLKAGVDVLVESGAGVAAGFPDADFEAAGARVSSDTGEVLGADLVLKVRAPQATGDGGHEVDRLREGGSLICFLNPLDQPELAERLAQRRVDSFSMELMPRVTRAQSMDALSSQSTISGYRAVVLAAVALPRIFPMLVTAAGTLQPAKVLVIGAGVAGLQALSTARRLGAVTSAYDTRDVVKEQVQSVGARFVELDLDAGDSEDAGGYAKSQSEEFYQRQRDQLAEHVAKADVVITTALVPGQQAPLLIEESAVRAMRPGSVVVDLAAEKGGNCGGTQADQEVNLGGVQVLGPTNLPSEVPAHASQMYARNITTFLDHLLEEGNLKVDLEDEITAGTLIVHQGAIVNERVLGLLGASSETG
ncbi:MAG: Re/Si-specific NAD(P)(+) transhydrogenase subunit alpha [Myxococcota bacterium]